MHAIARAGNAEPETIRDALHKTDYDAPNGHYRFTDKGQAYGFARCWSSSRRRAEGRSIVTGRCAALTSGEAADAPACADLQPLGSPEMDLFLQFLANGLVVGAFYALSALGLTLIFGLMRVVNFAHGEFYMLGGVLGWSSTTPRSVWISSPAWLLVAVIDGRVRLAGRPLADRARARPGRRGRHPADHRPVDLPRQHGAAGGRHRAAEGRRPVAQRARYSSAAWCSPRRACSRWRSCALLIMAAPSADPEDPARPAMRATFQDPMAAQLAGIRTATSTPAPSRSARTLAATAGMLLGSIYSAQASIGGLVSLKAFVVVILGGMGSFAGAIVGGLILGVTEALWGGYVATRHGRHHRLRAGDRDPAVPALRPVLHQGRTGLHEAFERNVLLRRRWRLAVAAAAGGRATSTCCIIGIMVLFYVVLATQPQPARRLCRRVLARPHRLPRHRRLYGGASVASRLACRCGPRCPLAGVVAGVFGFAIGAITLRLQGPFFVIVTLAFAEVLRLIANNWIGLTNGPMGLAGMPQPACWPAQPDGKQFYYYVALAAGWPLSLYLSLSLRVLQCRPRRRSRCARTATSRSRSASARSTYALRAFVLGAFLAGMAGGFYAHYISFVGPEVFGFSFMISMIIMVLVGGKGTLRRPAPRRAAGDPARGIPARSQGAAPVASSA